MNITMSVSQGIVNQVNKTGNDTQKQIYCRGSLAGAGTIEIAEVGVINVRSVSEKGFSLFFSHQTDNKAFNACYDKLAAVPGEQFAVEGECAEGVEAEAASIQSLF